MLKLRYILSATVMSLVMMLIPVFGESRKHPGLEPIQYAHAESMPESDSKPLEGLVPVPVDAKTIVESKAAQKGWTGAEWDALNKLVSNESGWRTNALNSSSGACGLFQALPCSKVKGDWQDPWKQAEFGLNYIENRYGSPSKALSFWYSNSPNWY